MPSVLVITRLLPLLDTATNLSPPYTTAFQPTAAAAVRGVHVIPSLLVMT